MKWYSPSAIAKEISRSKWSKKEEILTNSVKVRIIVALLAQLFVACQVVLSLVRRIMGVSE